MVVLALDTTARAGSCALARDGIVVAVRPSDPGGSHAEHLPGDLMTLLAQHDTALGEIDAFAVATGPGSFTGLRVGIATMQGLAFAQKRPLLGVTAVAALARIARDEAAGATVATWIDAWRGDVYAALHQPGSDGELTVAPPEALLAQLEGQGDIRFIGDGAATFRPLIEQRLGGRASFADPVSPLLAGTIARQATEAYRAGHRPGPDAIRPLYVRRIETSRPRDAAPGQ